MEPQKESQLINPLVLDVRGSDILQANGVIWVEGPSDKIYINKWIETFSGGTLREGVHFTFMLYGGKVLKHFDSLPPEELPKKISMLAINRNLAVVMDSDRRPRAWKTTTGKPRKPQMKLSDTKREIIKQVEDRKGMVWVTAGKEIENYIPKSVWDAVAGNELAIGSEYDDIPAFSELKKLAKTKVELAHLVEKHVSLSCINGHLDLEKRVNSLCEQIRQWNGLAVQS